MNEEKDGSLNTGFTFEKPIAKLLGETELIE